jgi:hypothetical protein
MVGKPLDLFGQAVGIERLKGFHDLGVEGPPLLRKETAVGHLVGKGVLEGIGEIREEVGLVQELCGLQVGEAMVELSLG